MCLVVEKLQNDWIRRYTAPEFRPNLCDCICATIDAMLNFDGDIDAIADIKCKQSIARFWFRDWSLPRCKSTELITGRTVVITGANSGMGKELANVLAVKGLLTTSMM